MYFADFYINANIFKMAVTPLICLDLRSPLAFLKSSNTLNDPLLPFEKEEFLLCFRLNPLESRSIEPDRYQFIEQFVFLGIKTDENAAIIHEETKKVILPAGNYLFNQCRSEQILNKDEWLDIAIEQQKDGLWERYKPGNLLYIRFLYEDSAFVTQVYRQIDD